MKKSILIITYHMAPFSQTWGQCQRMFFLSDQLVKNDFDVSVICAEENSYGSFGHSVLFPVKGILLKIIKGEKKSNKPRDFTNRDPNIIILSVVVYCRKMLKICEKFIFNEPNFGMSIYGLIFAWYARPEIVATIREKKTRTILISGPPFSIFLLTMVIRNTLPGIKIIMDYRDPWNTYSGSIVSFFLEKTCLYNADKYIFFNERMMNDTILRFRLRRKKCDFITNGYSKEDWDRIPENRVDRGEHGKYPGPMIISYVGSISFTRGGYRDLSTFFDAFELFQEDKDVLVRFVGVRESDDTDHLKRRFLDKIEFIPSVDHQNSLEYMCQTDILLHIHTDPATGKSVMAGKIFDYVKSGKILFVISTQEDAYCINFVRENNLGIVSLADKNDILNALNRFYTFWLKNELNNLRKDSIEDITLYSREYQNSKYLSVIEQLNNGKDH